MIKKIIISLMFLTISLYSEENPYIFGDDLNIRLEPDEKSESISKISGKHEIKIIEKIKNNKSRYKYWAKIQLDEIVGYVYEDYIYLPSDSPPKYPNNFAEVEVISEGKSIIIKDTKTKTILNRIERTKKIEYINRFSQLKNLLIVTYSNGNFDYDGFLFDLNSQKILLELKRKEFDLMTLGIDSISPHGHILVVNDGTTQIRNTTIIYLNSFKIVEFKGILCCTTWIGPKTFIYRDKPNKTETKLPIYKDDHCCNRLEEKRIWRNGEIFRTYEYSYSWEE